MDGLFEIWKIGWRFSANLKLISKFGGSKGSPSRDQFVPGLSTSSSLGTVPSALMQDRGPESNRFILILEYHWQEVIYLKSYRGNLAVGTPMRRNCNSLTIAYLTPSTPAFPPWLGNLKPAIVSFKVEMSGRAQLTGSRFTSLRLPLPR